MGLPGPGLVDPGPSPVELIPPEERGFNSRAIIDACRPYEWRDRFPTPIVTAERAEATRRKWGHLLAPTSEPVRAADATPV